MATKKLTDRAVKAAKTDRDRGEDFRDPVVRGLVLRVYASKTKTWGILYRTDGGRRRWFKLGDASALDLAEARRRAKVTLGKVAEGEDPQAEREASRRVGDV
ncbi:MAG: Arm DNA-binding domain-containing protein [Acidobacteria bacterium]|nr:Arm DNA-binding domain-containing protein [Acidobacteriota bacterium]